jgi:hypothetical protein
MGKHTTFPTKKREVLDDGLLDKFRFGVAQFF